jgi:hypothetical protein
MARPKKEVDDRIVELFLDMEVEDQAELLSDMGRLHAFCIRRDSRLKKPRAAAGAQNPEAAKGERIAET